MVGERAASRFHNPVMSWSRLPRVSGSVLKKSGLLLYFQGVEASRCEALAGFRGLISRELPVTPVSGIRACVENEM
jgi:hypothetical protein